MMAADTNTSTTTTTTTTTISITTNTTTATRLDYDYWEHMPGPLGPSEDILQIAYLHFLSVAGVLSLFGVLTNIINIVVFAKMGLQESVNVSFFTIAIADLVTLFLTVIGSVMISPLLDSLDLPFDPVSFQYEIVNTPHLIFTKIATIMTAYMTFERCISVSMPLKVKTIFTPKRTTIFVVLSFLLITSTSIPITLAHTLEKIVTPGNKTVLVFVFDENNQESMGVVNTFQEIAYSLVPFILTSVCTTILVVTLKKNTAWRQSNVRNVGSSSDQAASKEKQMAVRERKISSTVIVVAAWFIACYLPSVLFHIIIYLDTQFTMQNDAVLVFSAVSIPLQSLNSTVNIFIYYRNSSAYKTTFHAIFSQRKAKTESSG